MLDPTNTGSHTFDDFASGSLFEKLALSYDCLFARSFQNRYLRHVDERYLNARRLSVFSRDND